MKFTKSFKIALNIILHSKLRSWLTIIGIIIGIAAIVSIMSLGQGAQRTLEQNLNSLSANIITINPGFSRAAGAGAGFSGRDFGGPSQQTASSATSPKNLTVKDVLLLKTVPNVNQIMGTISGSVDVTYLSKTAKLSVQGVDPEVWRSITTTALTSGRYLVQGDTNAIVVGSRIANSTFSDFQINQKVVIAGKSYTVVGILKEVGGGDDSRIFMPIKDAVTILEGKTEKDFDSITIQVKDIALTDDTITQLTNKLMISHGILQANKKDFSITSLKSVQERVSSTLNSMSLFLSAIAAISLIVGAIGIMNTMFTSVLERTKDIGVLKAIGAKNSDILTIFLLNSGIIGLIGGVFGVIFGIIGSNFIGELAGFTGGGGGGGVGRLLSTTYIDPKIVFGVFLLSIAVGLIAGAIPAYRASRLKPVDALRYE